MKDSVRLGEEIYGYEYKHFLDILFIHLSLFKNSPHPLQGEWSVEWCLHYWCIVCWYAHMNKNVKQARYYQNNLTNTDTSNNNNGQDEIPPLLCLQYSNNVGKGMRNARLKLVFQYSCCLCGICSVYVFTPLSHISVESNQCCILWNITKYLNKSAWNTSTGSQVSETLQMEYLHLMLHFVCIPQLMSCYGWTMDWCSTADQTHLCL